MEIVRQLGLPVGSIGRPPRGRCEKAHAHHSFAAEFDTSKTVDFTEVVTKVEWMNPHVYFYVDVKEAAFVVQSPPGSKNSVAIWPEVALRKTFSGRFVFFPPYSYTHYPEIGCQ